MTTSHGDASNRASPAAWLEALGQKGAAERENAAALWQAWAEAVPRAVALLAEVMQDASTAVRAKAVSALAALGRQAREIQGPLNTALKRAMLWDEDEAVRKLAAESLIKDGDWARTPIADLIKALNDPEAAIRFSAAQSLGERGEESLPAVGTLLNRALGDADGGVRLEAAMSLFKIDGRVEKILPVLIKALQEADEVRRWIAADCLGEIGPPAREAIPALRDVLQLEFKSPLIRASIALALEKIEGKPSFAR
jgi:HEAT repeat protein